MQAAAKRVGLHRTEGALPHVSGGFHGEQDGVSWELGGHVTVGLPIFDRAQGKIISAKSELGALRERYVATNRVRGEAGDALSAGSFAGA